MNKKRIILLMLLFIVVIGATMSSASATDYPTKYKLGSSVTNYDVSDTYYSRGYWYWEPKDWNINNAEIREKSTTRKSKLTIFIYNNNNDRYHHLDVKKCYIKVFYKVEVRAKYFNYYIKTKKFTINKIGPGGSKKTITIKDPKNRHIKVLGIYRKQVYRIWY